MGVTSRQVTPRGKIVTPIDYCKSVEKYSPSLGVYRPESRVENCEETFPWRIADRVGMKVKIPPVYSEENRRVLAHIVLYGKLSEAVFVVFQLLFIEREAQSI